LYQTELVSAERRLKLQATAFPRSENVGKRTRVNGICNSLTNQLTMLAGIKHR
jgi:hypothetical protein